MRIGLTRKPEVPNYSQKNIARFELKVDVSKPRGDPQTEWSGVGIQNFSESGHDCVNADYEAAPRKYRTVLPPKSHGRIKHVLSRIRARGSHRKATTPLSSARLRCAMSYAPAIRASPSRS
ncbi:hypothetical protein AG1IA_03225 [Rhizoctonia solani AG-1 IA]|uniref:Uncharacterized protein n=1 Tax=Thanatephorus cucumeris (strain AG1-IA) TaxID=983506 RepID=L8X143_THACA|nr:hypothetical protein AG1IA_03225 [Rhizoctonia solani AG-1 IA]